LLLYIFLYTGRFKMHSRITKIYDKKTVGHVFTKPVQIEGTTQKSFPQKLFFIVVHISAAGCLCKQKSSCRQLTVKDDVERARASFLHSPKKSTGTAPKELSVPFNSVVLRWILWFSCYKCNHGEHFWQFFYWYYCHIHNHPLTLLWSRIILEKMPFARLANKLPSFMLLQHS
jgi:hypothetical protein